MPQLHAWAAEKMELSSMIEEEHCVISQSSPCRTVLVFTKLTFNWQWDCGENVLQCLIQRPRSGPQRSSSYSSTLETPHRVRSRVSVQCCVSDGGTKGKTMGKESDQLHAADYKGHSTFLKSTNLHLSVWLAIYPLGERGLTHLC